MTANIKINPANMTDVVGFYIKDVITAYPAVGAVLEAAGIGCVTCSVGTCLIKDVVSIHNLTEAQEHSLFAGIAAVIFPGRTMALPKTERKLPPAGANKLSPPLQALVNEHTNIKRVLARIPALAIRIQQGLDADTRQTVSGVIDFVRQYADKYHHAKEEDILFKYFDAGSDILAVMYKEHEIGRQHVRSALTALEQGDASAIMDHLNAYGVLLKEHIRKEDEILYPWMNRELTDSQVGQLFSKFSTVDEQFGAKASFYLGMVDKLEMG
ncbi:MAG: hemerythrin domain-containing protein [bacterium]|jgi:hemerythrin-like domain-containing protein